MAELPSFTTTTTDSTTDVTNDKVKQTTISQHTDTNTTDKKSYKDERISSSHPRFSTLKIVPNFSHIQH